MELRRHFTVRTSGTDPCELLTINKKNLFQMKVEFRQYFNEFFEGGIGELEKTIQLKMYAMELCDKRYKEWADAKQSIGTVQYNVRTLTNRELNSKSREALRAFIKKALEEDAEYIEDEPITR